jgi:aspartyl-tRNA(Asn)/glutamyl-tRNA(Gln) amidotransferase subunit C
MSSEHLTDEKVRHLARLARLELNDQEVSQFADQLTSVIDYNMTLLGEADVAGVEPTAQTTGLVNRWREDVVKPSLSVAEALSQAPRQGNGLFEVPAVLDVS